MRRCNESNSWREKSLYLGPQITTRLILCTIILSPSRRRRTVQTRAHLSLAISLVWVKLWNSKISLLVLNSRLAIILSLQPIKKLILSDMDTAVMSIYCLTIIWRIQVSKMTNSKCLKPSSMSKINNLQLNSRPLRDRFKDKETISLQPLNINLYTLKTCTKERGLSKKIKDQ